MPLNGVRHNALFVTDLNSVPLKDLTADDNGSWDISTLRRMYKVEESGEEIQQVLMYTHYTDSLALTKPPKSKRCGVQTAGCNC